MRGTISKALAELHVLPPSELSASGSVEANTPAEIAELVVIARQAFGDTLHRAIGYGASNGWDQPAIYPADSILQLWMDFARSQEESADAFLIGSILPICAALLARRVWFRWGSRRKYPNLFSMLAGKPGDRKSSAILLAEAVGRRILPANAFLPMSFSPETLFDEYAEGSGGRADKIWVVDDANSVLKDWQKSVNGQRVATRFLELYDCKSLSESFRRNKEQSKDGSASRKTSETSTSLVYGATFAIAAFQHQEVRAGMARRFIYYVAERHGRMIIRPPENRELAFAALVEKLRPLGEIAGEIDFDPKAFEVWTEYQRANRDQLDRTDLLREAELARLSSAPMQTLSVAMIFEACRQMPSDGVWNRRIKAITLTKAIEHVEACLCGARRLEQIADRAEIAQDAEILLSKIRHSFPAIEGFHFATRSEITKQFCSNSTRTGSWRPDDIYLRFIPTLEEFGHGRLVKKTGKREVYAFVAESSG